MSTPFQPDLVPAPEPDVEDVFDGFQDAAPGGKVYLYTTNPKLTHGKRQALLTVLPAPLDLLELQRAFGGGPYYAILHVAGQAVSSRRFALAGPPLLEQRLEPQARPELVTGIWAQAAPAAAPPSELVELREQMRELAASVKLLADRPAPAAAVQVLPPEDPLKARVTELLLDQLGVRQSGTVGGALEELLKARRALRRLEDEEREDKPEGELSQLMPLLVGLLPMFAGGRAAVPALPGQVAPPAPAAAQERPRRRVGRPEGASGTPAASNASHGAPAAAAGTPPASQALEPRWQMLVAELVAGVQLAAAGKERAADRKAARVLELGDVLLTEAEREQLATPGAAEWLAGQLATLAPVAAPSLASEAGKNWLASVLALVVSPPEDDDDEAEELEGEPELAEEDASETDEGV